MTSHNLHAHNHPRANLNLEGTIAWIDSSKAKAKGDDMQPHVYLLARLDGIEQKK